MENPFFIPSKSQHEQQSFNMMDYVTAMVAKILAFLETVAWVLMWCWKAAPVAIMEVSSGGEQFSFLSNRWLKLLAVCGAVGFYLVLFQFVCMPILQSMESDTTRVAISITILLFHFISGIVLHKTCLSEPFKEESQNTDSKQAQNRLRHPSPPQSSSMRMESIHNMQASETDWVAIDDGDLPATGISSMSLPSLTLQQPPLLLGAPPVSPHKVPNRPPRPTRGLWPFRQKSETPRILLDSNIPNASIV